MRISAVNYFNITSYTWNITCPNPKSLSSKLFLFHPLHLSESAPQSTAGAAKSLQLWPTLRNPMDCSPPGSAVHGIFQARVLEWFAMAFSATAHSCCVFFIVLFIVCPSSLPSSIPSSVIYTLILLGSQRPEMSRSSQRLPLFMLPFAAPSPPPRGSDNV